jgi:hypothetical protein
MSDNAAIAMRHIRPSRRLSDKLFIAFDHACDQADFEVAALLLTVLEVMTRRPAPKEDRRCQESLVAGYERLWHLRNGRMQ